MSYCLTLIYEPKVDPVVNIASPKSVSGLLEIKEGGFWFIRA